MKPPVFDYAAPRSLEEAVGLLAEHGPDAKVLAGGQSLMPLLNMRLARPALLVDIARIPGLDYIRKGEAGLAVGAMTRQRTVEFSPLVRDALPILHAATLFVAHPQNRNQGTLCGSLAHADPAAEYPALAVALGARLKAQGRDGERVIDAEEFFVTYLTTALEPTELVTEVVLPSLPERTGWAMLELARRHGDYALAGVVATLTLDRTGGCTAARLVLFGVGPTPLRMRQAEDMMAAGAKPTPALFEDAGAQAAASLDEPLSDVHATGEYRRDLARTLTRRALTQAHARAQAVQAHV